MVSPLNYFSKIKFIAISLTALFFSFGCYGMLQEDEEDEDDILEIVVVEYDSKNGSLSISPSMQSVKMSDRATIFTASLAPGMLQTKPGVGLSIKSVRGGQIDTTGSCNGFMGLHQLEDLFPLVTSALTYLTRKREYTQQQASTTTPVATTAGKEEEKKKKDIVGYSSDLQRYAISKQWLEACEKWLKQRIRSTHSAVFPEKGKPYSAYATLPESADSKLHVSLEHFLRVLFMSLSIQADSLVTNVDDIIKVLDEQYNNNWDDTLYSVEACTTFIKAMRHFSYKNGPILKQLTECVETSPKTLKVFYSTNPVASVICAQAMSDETKDELCRYSKSHVRLLDSQEHAFKSQREEIAQMSSVYPKLCIALQQEIGTAFLSSYKEDVIVRAAQQLLYTLHSRADLLASFHAVPLTAADACAKAKGLLGYLEETSKTVRSDSMTGKAVLTLCDWACFLPLFHDIREKLKVHTLFTTHKELLSVWLAKVPVQPDFKSYDCDLKTFTTIESHGVALYALLRGYTSGSIPPWHHVASQCLTQDCSYLIDDFSLNYLHLCYYFSQSSYRSHFTSVTKVAEFHSALNKVTHTRYEALSRSSWTGAL
ncbi:hypothetical protein ACWJJH_08655 [Endozoicomonadaceae bacterium StTr2]